MANIQPQTQLICCKDVRMDKGYKHAYYLGQQVAGRNNGEIFVEYHLLQAEHFVMAFENYTYFREDSFRIRVKCRADDLWHINYIAYRNPIIGATKPDKWFFGFVDETVYVNNETTDIYFTPDILTTWWDEAILKQCFVERMHEPNDYFGKNIMSEPIKYGDYKCGISNGNVLRTSLVNLRPTWTVVPYAKQDDEWDWRTGMTYGTMAYDGVVSGYKCYCWDTEQICDQNSNQHSMFTNWMHNFFNVLTDGKRILGLFSIPKDILDSEYVHYDEDDNDLPVIDYPNNNEKPAIVKWGYLLSEEATLDGYSPANMKMYTAPFCVAEVIAPNGDAFIVRHEYMPGVVVTGENEFDVNVKFRVLSNIFPPVSIVVRPEIGYACREEVDDIGYDANIQLCYSDLPVGSWTWGIFESWVAQKFIPTIIDTGLIAASLGGALNITTAMSGSEMTKSLVENSKTGAIMNRQTERSYERQTTSNTGVISGIKQSANFGKEVYSWLSQTPATRGSVKSDAVFATNEAIIECRCLCPNYQDAERIDRFLTTYGYTQDKVMQPMRCVRTGFTYLQTNDCIVTGNLPSELCAELSNIYNNGITFWRDLDAIGEYDFSRGGNRCLENPLI